MSSANPATALDELRELYGMWGLYLIKLGHRSKVPVESEWNERAEERAANVSRLADADQVAALEEHLTAMARHVESGGNLGLAIPPRTLVLDADTPEAVRWLERHPALEDGPSQQTRKGRTTGRANGCRRGDGIEKSQGDSRSGHTVRAGVRWRIPQHHWQRPHPSKPRPRDRKVPDTWDNREHIRVQQPRYFADPKLQPIDVR